MGRSYLEEAVNVHTCDCDDEWLVTRNCNGGLAEPQRDDAGSVAS